MSATQDYTIATKVTDNDITIINYSMLTAQQQTWVDYKAINGLVINDDGMRKMSIEELSGQLGLERKTLYNWTRSIPGFWELVAQRRKELAGQNRLAKMQEVWELKALKGDWQFFNAWQLNFNPSYRVPTQKVEHEASHTLTALLGRARESNRKDNAIEAEVVDEPSSDNA